MIRTTRAKYNRMVKRHKLKKLSKPPPFSVNAVKESSQYRSILDGKTYFFGFCITPPTAAHLLRTCMLG